MPLEDVFQDPLDNTEKAPEVTLSIVIPTLNPSNSRLAALLASLFSTPSKDFEVVVADNASETVVDLSPSLREEPRLMIRQFQERVDVASNWTRATCASRGRFIWLIGDDDFVTRRQLERALSILGKTRASIVTFAGSSYVFPGQLNSNIPLVRESVFRVAPRVAKQISSGDRLQVVSEMFHFRPLIPMNMQLTIFSRGAFNRAGGKFEMPFPDHILLTRFLASSDRWEFFDDKLCVVGMAPDSFGYRNYLNQANDASDYLGKPRSPDSEAGSDLVRTMAIWLNQLSLEPQFEAFQPSVADYQIRQLGHLYRQWRSGYLDGRDLAIALRKVTLRDSIHLLLAATHHKNFRKVWFAISRPGGPSLIMGDDFVPSPGLSIETFASRMEING